MKNLLDQYNSPENRLTHALGSCLQRDPWLFREFVKWTTGRPAPSTRRRVEIVEQSVPGMPTEPWDEDEDEGAGPPDLWIHDNTEWALGAALPYGDPRLHLREVLEVIAGVWVACRPWIKSVVANR